MTHIKNFGEIAHAWKSAKKSLQRCEGHREKEMKKITKKLIGAAIKAHKALGFSELPT